MDQRSLLISVFFSIFFFLNIHTNLLQKSIWLVFAQKVRRFSYAYILHYSRLNIEINWTFINDQKSLVSSSDWDKIKKLLPEMVSSGINVYQLINSIQKMGGCAARRHLDPSNPIDNNSPQPTLEFQIKSWPKNRHVNFKDESTCIKESLSLTLGQLENQRLQLFSSSDKENTLTPSHSKGNDDVNCFVTRKKETYQIVFQGKDIYRSAFKWLQLKEKDVCLIGRTKYTLCKIIEQHNYKEQQIKSTTHLGPVTTQTLEDSEVKCRICYSSQQTSINPLISPCNCKGSIEFIHMKCLSDWLFGRIQYNEMLHMHTKKSTCEICKTNITETEAYKSIIANLLSGNNNIPAPFAIFEGSLTKQNKEHKSYMILSFSNKKEFKLGRSKEADISDTSDLFISRINSIISYRYDRLWIRDNQSKHGTGIVISNKLSLSPENNVENLIYGNMNIQISYLQGQNL